MLLRSIGVLFIFLLGITLQSDAVASTLAITNNQVTEGNSGTKNANFIISLSPASASTVTVDFATADDSATIADNDYQSNSGTVTFSPGQTSKQISVAVVGDTKIEPNERFFVNLSNAVGATISDSQAQGTITNDDTGGSSLSINNVTVAEGDSGTTDAVFTVTLSPSSGSVASVDFVTANGTATTGDSDYQSNSGTLTFSAGQTSRQITVLVNGDTKVENNETFVVNLSNASGASISDSQGQGTITNDDSAPSSLSISNVTVTEGDSGTTNAVFTVTLSPSSGSLVTVDFATANGTATTGDSDYQSNSGSLSFGSGQTSKQVTVLVNGDTAVENNETFVVNLSNASGAAISDGQGQGTITNDDSASTSSLSINNVTVAEGNSGTTSAAFTVTLSPSSGSTVTVSFGTANGTATTANSDYQSNSGTVTFSSGQTSKQVTVLVNGDTTVENNETFFVNLSNPSGASILDNQGTGTIQNDDSAQIPALSVANANVTEGDSGLTNVSIRVTLSQASTANVTVRFGTNDRTATVGNADYRATTGTLTFSPGQTSKVIVVPVVGDTAPESDEAFQLQLANASGATLADASSLITIVNDEITQPPIQNSTAGSGIDSNSVDTSSTEFMDYNNDQKQDLLLTGSAQLFKNTGNGKFVDVTSSANVPDVGEVVGSASGDMDNDADLDLLIVFSSGDPLLLSNNGKGSFTEESIFTHSQTLLAATRGAIWLDYDNDGKLDIFVIRDGAPNQLLRNEGTTFVDVAPAAKVAFQGPSRGAVAVDFDGDGFQDIYLVNFKKPNKLYKNLKNGAFQEISKSAKVAFSGSSAQAIVDDYNRDGLPDLFVVNGGGPSILYKNLGNFKFLNVTRRSGLFAPRKGKAAAFLDFDNDEDDDLLLLQTNGENLLFRNENDRFARVTTVDLSTPHQPSGISTGDFNSDGLIDFFVGDSDETQNNDSLYKNVEGIGNSWLIIQPQGRVSNRSGIGTTIQVKTESFTQTKFVSGGTGQNQESLPVEFGLGDSPIAKEIRVLWPSGIVQICNHVAAERKIKIIEQSRCKIVRQR